MPREMFRTLFYPGLPISTHQQLEGQVTREIAEGLRAYRALLGARDVFGIFAYPEPGIAVVLWGALDRFGAPTPFDRRVFQRIAGHIDSGLRLRARPELAVAAVLSPAGALLDLEVPALSQSRERLASRVAAIEGSRLRRRRREPDAINDWEALVDGRYSLVPRDDRDGKRYYLLVVNGPAPQAHARFTTREIDVLRMSARGFTGKGIAYSLGLTPASVSVALGRAAAKVGLRSRVQLVEVAAALFGARVALRDPEALTPAEREVLELLRRGLSNAEIARLRERSLRTVANQVSSILRKTGSPSRRALAAARPR
jgi:DNA-binding NarL/FixJ family response regulator